MTVNDADARKVATELVTRLKQLRSRGMSEIDEAESAIRKFAASYGASMESELVELRYRTRQQKEELHFLHDTVSQQKEELRFLHDTVREFEREQRGR